MKKFLTAAAVLLLVWSCSKNETAEEQPNPYRPISDLVIPREIATGEKATLLGRGFASDCRLEMRMNGSVEKAAATVLGVDERSLTFEVPASLQLGFYSLLLTQHSKTSTIGGVNVKGDQYRDEDFQIYALAGDKLEIYPLSVAKQLKGRTPLPNSSASVPGYSGFAEGLPDGMVYYTGFEPVQGGKLLFKVGSYNTKTGANQSPREVANMFAMGQIDGKFHILKTSDYTTYTLVAWDNGVETVVKTFDLSASGAQRILVPDQRFVYHAPTRTIIIYGNMGSGSDMGQATFSLDLETGAVNQNGGVATSYYWFATDGEALYAFVVREADEVSSTQVYRIDNPQQWKINGSGATLVASLSGNGFECPVYSPVSKRIYGVNNRDAYDVILTFNPATHTFENRRWVSPGVACMVFTPQVILPQE